MIEYYFTLFLNNINDYKNLISDIDFSGKRFLAWCRLLHDTLYFFLVEYEKDNKTTIKNCDLYAKDILSFLKEAGKKLNSEEYKTLLKKCLSHISIIIEDEK